MLLAIPACLTVLLQEKWQTLMATINVKPPPLQQPQKLVPQLQPPQQMSSQVSKDINKVSHDLPGLNYQQF